MRSQQLYGYWYDFEDTMTIYIYIVLQQEYNKNKFPSRYMSIVRHTVPICAFLITFYQFVSFLSLSLFFSLSFVNIHIIWGKQGPWGQQRKLNTDFRWSFAWNKMSTTRINTCLYVRYIYLYIYHDNVKCN